MPRLDALPEPMHDLIARGAKVVHEYGASDQELDQIVDHRFVLMARDAMMYKRAKAKGKEGKIRAKKRGRVLAPGAKPLTSESSRGKRTPKRAKVVARARNRLARSGRIEDAAAALLASEDE